MTEFLTKKKANKPEDGMTLTLREMVDMALASESKRLLQIMDPFLASTATEEEGEVLEEALKLGLSCTSTEPEDRPDITEV